MNTFATLSFVIAWLAVFLAPAASLLAGEPLIIKMKDGSSIEAASVHDDGQQLNYTTMEGLPGFVSKKLVFSFKEKAPEPIMTSPPQAVTEPLTTKEEPAPAVKPAKPPQPDVIDAIEKKASKIPPKPATSPPAGRMPILRDTMTREQYNKAEQELKNIAREYPEDYGAFLQLGLLAVLRDKNHEKAILYYTESIKRNPKIAYAYQSRARSFLSLGKCGSVIEDCSRILEMNPKDTAALDLRAECLEKEGKTAQAIQDYRKIKQYSPSSKQRIHMMFAELNVKQGILFPDLENDVDFLLSRATYLVEDKEFEAAQADLQSVIKLDANNGKAYYKLGKLYESTYRDDEKALQFYDKAVELDG